MHHTSHSSSLPRRSASVRLASLIQTASSSVRPPRRTAGLTIGSETPAVSTSRSASSCGIATQVLAAKSQTLNVPAIPRAARSLATSTPSAGKTRRRMPSGAANERSFSARQRSQACAGVTPDSSIARLKVPPEVPSAWWKRSPASSSATSTPAW